MKSVKFSCLQGAPNRKLYDVRVWSPLSQMFISDTEFRRLFSEGAMLEKLTQNLFE